MNIELKEIDKDTLKVGDVVGIAREVQSGWRSSFRHDLITPAKIVRITPKRTKFITDKFGEHDRKEPFYEYNLDAIREDLLAKNFVSFQDGVYELKEFERKVGLREIDDKDLREVSDCMGRIVKILKKYNK